MSKMTLALAHRAATRGKFDLDIICLRLGCCVTIY